MESAELEYLKKRYGVTFERFMQEAQETWRLVGGITECPVSLAERNLLTEQRSRENEAYNNYVEVRLEMMRLAAGRA
jgi:hypothetical protein